MMTLTDAELAEIKSEIDTVAPTIEDVYVLVKHIADTVDKIIPLIVKAGEIIDPLAEEVKTKGLMGILPMVMSAMRK